MAARGYDDVRPAHGFAFQRIAPHGATGNELAEFLDVTKQAASEMVDYLEQRGYVVRQPHPSDKRGKIILLTERSWNCIREAEAILSHLEAQWTAISNHWGKADGRAPGYLVPTGHGRAQRDVATEISSNMVALRPIQEQWFPVALIEPPSQRKMRF